MAGSKFDVVNSIITWGSYILVGDGAIIAVESTSEAPAPNAFETMLYRTADGRLGSNDSANESFDFSLVYYPQILESGRDTLDNLYNDKYDAPLTIANKDGTITNSYSRCILKNNSFLADGGLSKGSTVTSTISFQVGNDDDSRN